MRNEEEKVRGRKKIKTTRRYREIRKKEEEYRTGIDNRNNDKTRIVRKVSSEKKEDRKKRQGAEIRKMRYRATRKKDRK